jgi:copper transport protein
MCSVVAAVRRVRALAALFATVAAIAALAGAGTASAHTGFESSTPADGDSIVDPVGEMTIRFTGPATPAGDGFVALDGDGTVRTPTGVATPDDRTFVLAFDPPLAGGTIGIRWRVAAADSHPIEGAFSFTVTAPTPTTPATTAATDSPTTTTPATDEGAAVAPTTTTNAAVPATGPPTSIAAAAPAGGSSTTTLEEFLDVDDSTAGETTARVGRVISFLGVTLALGVLAFAAVTFRGSRREVRGVLDAARVLGVVIAAGAVVEYIGVARIADEALGSAWSTEPGVAAGLRIVGGLAIAVGVVATVVSTRPDVDRRSTRALSAATVEQPIHQDLALGTDSSPSRWAPDRRSIAALVGAVLVLASFWFDGHTVTEGVRPVHALVDSVHVAAGSVWVGGVVALSAIAWLRHRRREESRMAELVVRFSSVATVALASVVVAGVLMAAMIADGPGDLTGTEWGRTLLLKTAAVGLAVLAGAYNHFRLVPRLEADPDAEGLQAELRGILTAEAIVLCFVVVVTAWLVVAAT